MTALVSKRPPNGATSWDEFRPACGSPEDVLAFHDAVQRQVDLMREYNRSFWSLIDALTEAERKRRSRHPRFHSKGRRSRWPRGV